MQCGISSGSIGPTHRSPTVGQDPDLWSGQGKDAVGPAECAYVVEELVVMVLVVMISIVLRG